MDEYKEDREFVQKYLDEAQAREKLRKQTVLDLDAAHEKLQTYALFIDVLTQLETNVARSAHTVESNKFLIYDHVDKVRGMVWEIMEATKDAMTVANIPFGIYLGNVAKNARKMMKETIQMMNKQNALQEQPKYIQEAEITNYEDEVSDTEPEDKSKSMIIKMKYAKKFVEPIKAYIPEAVPVRTFELLDESKILITFENPIHCRKFKMRLERIFPGIEVIEQPDEDAELILDSIGQISRKDLQREIKKITGEKPNVIKLIEINKEQKWRARISLSSLAMLKVRALNKSTIVIGGVETAYYQVPEWAVWVECGKEECSDSKPVE